jgi:hypothetical protein
MSDTISTASLRTFIQTVKLDHIVWKGQVYAVVSGRSDKQVSQFSDHTMCRLGEWYCSDASKDLKQSSAFTRLESPHAQVHKNGVDAIEQFQLGNKSLALQHLRNMESASDEMLEILTELTV